MTDLRERVARAMWHSEPDAIPFYESASETQHQYLKEADAAIAIVLEEAAKLIEDHTPRFAEGNFQGHLVKRMTFDSIGLPYAAAIRALKENS